MTYKVGMVSLGCCKNQIDAEVLLAKLKHAGFEITGNETQADVIIINTCGFIESAKTEAIENILDIVPLKKENLKAIIITGCLAERYKSKILKEIPEVDAVVGIGKNSEIVDIVKSTLKGTRKLYLCEKEKLEIDSDRILTTPFYTAYIKIAEGCDNYCSYCAIPSIRGRFRSRTMESIVEEAKMLVKGGVKELIVVAQDTTRYGEDLYGKKMLPQLLKRLCEIENLCWIRTLYTYPDKITQELLDVVASQDKLVKYLDIPIQHCNCDILNAMNRKGDKKSLETTIEQIRNSIPDVTLRTTLITGFPGETQEQFEELCSFVKNQKFDWLGCFTYSAEEGTVAATMKNQVDHQKAQDRSETIMNDQLVITVNKNTKRLNKTYEVLVEGYDNYIKSYYGRAGFHAPDIDGKIFFTSKRDIKVGSFVKVLVKEVLEYDLLGVVEE